MSNDTDTGTLERFSDEELEREAESLAIDLSGVVPTWSDLGITYVNEHDPGGGDCLVLYELRKDFAGGPPHHFRLGAWGASETIASDILDERLPEWEADGYELLNISRG